jgi:Xaa-Pro dipeptidase
MGPKLSAGTSKNRLARLFSNLKGTDVVLIANTDRADPNFHYLTGFTSGLFESSLLLAHRDRMHLFTYSLEYETGMEEKPENMSIVNIMADARSARAMLGKLLKGKRVGFNGAFLPFETYRHIQSRYRPKRMVDVSDGLSATRLIKDGTELKHIRKAVRITKTAMREIPKYFKEGMTELELMARFDFIQLSLGANESAEYNIVAFGKNTALPHHFSGNTRLRKGDLIIIDAGAVVNNYYSDISRTFIFGAKGSARQKEMLQTVREAQKKAMGVAKSGRKWIDMHNTAAAFLDSTRDGRYKGEFIHAIGHSIGLEMHDNPASYLSTRKLEPGMVITVEPGVYEVGFGGVRIEDDILITKNGYKIL